jgi:hypothetical protein
MASPKVGPPRPLPSPRTWRGMTEAPNDLCADFSEVGLVLEADCVRQRERATLANSIAWNWVPSAYYCLS